MKKDGSNPITSVYRKPTHTDRYRHYSSRHYPKVQSGIIDCLQHRAEQICKQDSALADEKKHVQIVLMTNGYPKPAVVQKQRRKQGASRSGQPKARVFLPDIKGISKKICTPCRPSSIHTTFISRSTLRNSLTKVKRKLGMVDVEGTVYSIPCGDCSATYAGETRRTLKVLMAEWKRAVKNKDPNNGIALHVQKTAHTTNWKEARVLVKENN